VLLTPFICQVCMALNLKGWSKEYMVGKKGSRILKTACKKMRWGQICLIVAVILNALVLLINLHLSGLEDELASKREEERYFIINEQSKYGEINKRTLIHTSLNQLKMLRRLATDLITPEEKQMLLTDEKIFQREINASLRKAVIVTYLQGNDPPPGKNPQDMFSGMTDEQLLALSPKFESQALQYISNLKTEMVRLMDEISLWKKLYSYGLIISLIIIVVANFLIYAGRESAEAI